MLSPRLGSVLSATVEGEIGQGGDRRDRSLINVYAPNEGAERLEVFNKLKAHLTQCSQSDSIIWGSDWNCMTDLTIDGTGEEPHLQSSSLLSSLVRQFNLLDAWRTKHHQDRQYTWVKMANNRYCGARLDRFYISQSICSRLISSCIHPVGFTDHHLVNSELFPLPL